MTSKTKKTTAVMAAFAVITTASAGFISACAPKSENSGYTYNDYASSLATNWNPHTWEMDVDRAILDFVASPFVDISIDDSNESIYQWVYEMATEVNDVTASNLSDLTKYGSVFTGTPDSGYVYEIKLNPDACWQNGEKITADDYLYSMEQLLRSDMRNYRANLYISGENALAGARAFYNSDAPIYSPAVPPYGDDEEPDYSFDLTSKDVYINLNSEEMTVAPYSFKYLYEREFIEPEAYAAFDGAANAYGYIRVTDDNKQAVYTIIDQYLSAFDMSIYTDEGKTQINEELYKEFLFYISGTGAHVDFDKVGLYKVDDYTIRYVLNTYEEKGYFLSSLTGATWLVYKDLYEANFDTSGELVTTSYGTSVDKTMSYGVYKLQTYEADRQLVLVHNENWYGFDKNDDGELVRDEYGNLVSHTKFEVDGKHVRQWQTSKIVIDVIQPDTAESVFLKGDLTSWTPSATKMSQYRTSDKLYSVDDTYTTYLYFNTDLNALKGMDSAEGNENSVVVRNDNFRKAFSLAINRSEWVSATAGYHPAYSLMNGLYFYDIFNDPDSSYRKSDEAMQAICNLYGVEYGADKTYKTLEEAYGSITGYNLTEAKELMKTAYSEITADSEYGYSGGNIKIRIAWAGGALTSDHQQQVALLEKYLNAAAEGSGFGKITLEAVGNVDTPYSQVPAGKFAIGYGAWGGAAFYPFRNFQVYMDPDNYDLNEAACWDPTTETVTLNVGGKDVTMTWQAWSQSMMGVGQYATADNATKLSITSQLEEKYLAKYYSIPLASMTNNTILSYKVSYYTENYNIMYDFGGLRLLVYNYNDDQWAQFVKDNNGKLSYV